MNPKIGPHTCTRNLRKVCIPKLRGNTLRSFTCFNAQNSPADKNDFFCFNANYNNGFLEVLIWFTSPNKSQWSWFLYLLHSSSCLLAVCLSFVFHAFLNKYFILHLRIYTSINWTLRYSCPCFVACEQRTNAVIFQSFKRDCLFGQLICPHWLWIGLLLFRYFYIVCLEHRSKFRKVIFTNSSSSSKVGQIARHSFQWSQVKDLNISGPLCDKPFLSHWYDWCLHLVKVYIIIFITFLSK